MPDDDLKAKIEREARMGHRFSLADVLGVSGGGLMSGASPVPRPSQVAAVIDGVLAAGLDDSSGVLRRTMMTTLFSDPMLLESHFDRPLQALVQVLERVLRAEDVLVELVRATDAAWGREMDERPMFELAGRPPLPGDPYTHASVRKDLEALLLAVRAAEHR